MTQSQQPSTGVENPDKPVPEPNVSVPAGGQAGGQADAGGAEKPLVTKKARSATAKPAQKGGSAASSVKGNVTTAWLSYHALSDVAETIAGNLEGHLDGNVVIIAGDSALDDLRQWRLFESALSGALNYCDSVLAQYGLPPAAQPEEAELGIQAGLEAWTAALTAVSGILGFFKTKTTATQHQFDLDENAMVSAVAAQILAKKSSTVIKTLRSMAARSNPPNEGAKAIAKLMTAKAKATDLGAVYKDDAVKRAELDAIVKLVDGTVDRVQFFRGGETAGSILNGEIIHKALSEDGTFLLDLKLVIGGGDQISIERNFLHTEEFYVNGVAAVSYSLVGADGSILSTGNVHAHTGYRRYDLVENGVW